MLNTIQIIPTIKLRGNCLAVSFKREALEGISLRYFYLVRVTCIHKLAMHIAVTNSINPAKCATKK